MDQKIELYDFVRPRTEKDPDSVWRVIKIQPDGQIVAQNHCYELEPKVVKALRAGKRLKGKGKGNPITKVRGLIQGRRISRTMCLEIHLFSFPCLKTGACTLSPCPFPPSPSLVRRIVSTPDFFELLDDNDEFEV